MFHLQVKQKPNFVHTVCYVGMVRSPTLLILNYFWITEHLCAVINGILRPSCRKYPGALEQDFSSSLSADVN